MTFLARRAYGFFGSVGAVFSSPRTHTVVMGIGVSFP